MGGLLSVSSLDEALGRACRAARRALSAEYPLREEGQSTLGHLPGRPSWRALWHLDASETYPGVSLFVGIPQGFPYHLPKVYLADGPAELAGLPHIDGRRFICTFDEATAKPNPDDPAGVALACVERALEILRGNRGPDSGEAYVDELKHYWGAYEQDLSIVPDLERERGIKRAVFEKSWAGYAAVLADSEEEARRWALNAGVPGRLRIEDALLLPVAGIGRPPFPETNSQLAEALARTDPAALRRLERFLSKNTRRPASVVCAIGTGDIPVLAGWSHGRSKYRSANGRRDLHGALPGFRRGHHPSGFELRGYGASTVILRRNVDRVDAERLFRRSAGRAPEPNLSKVSVIGAGSVGSILADALARAAEIEELTICDPETLGAENVPRHLCAFDQIGRGKADAVATSIARRLPTMKTVAIRQDALGLLREGNTKIAEADLILVAIGSTTIEEIIVRELLSTAAPGTPVVVAWVEPFLAAGHAVCSIAGSPGCFACLMGEGREYSRRVVLNAGKFVLSDPGCSPGYVPYGGADLGVFVHRLAGVIAKSLRDGPWQFRCTGDLGAARSEGADIVAGCASYEVTTDFLPPRAGCPVCGHIGAAGR